MAQVLNFPHFPIFIYPQTDNFNFFEMPTQQFRRFYNMPNLRFFQGGIAGAIMMTDYGKRRGTVFIQGNINSPHYGINQAEVFAFGEN